jgi:sugar lactone lactonase YvrE
MSRDGRLFVNFPRWSPDVPVSVAELVNGELVPYPDVGRNSWSPDGDVQEQFVCVQSVVADGEGSLWVLDPASPGLAGVVAGGAKLMQFDLETNELVRVFRYAEPIIKPSSYLNDVRIDLEAGVAYITDSGDGALVVTDLESAESRRLLDDHPSTQAEDVVLTIEGEQWLPGGGKPQVHADGIALSPDRRFLYYQALTGRTLYRVSTEALRNSALSAEELGEGVEVMGTTGAADGLIFGTDGKLYISALEENAIKRFDPETRDVETVVQDDAIRWPDTFTRDADGRIYFTTAQIHLGPNVTEPYRIFRIEETPFEN